MGTGYLDIFLAFLGMTFLGVSALPGLFFQRKTEASRKPQMGWLDPAAKSKR
jgi:hypothetical protein